MKLITILLVQIFSVQAQTRTMAVLGKARHTAQIPAIGVATFKATGPATLTLSGTTRAEGKVPLDKKLAWHIGSDTKAMTATLIAILVEKSLLDWDTSMAEIFPKLAPDFHPKARLKTITKLLSHTAGLPANPSPSQRTKTRLAITKIGLALEPSEGFLYSNYGYLIAGAVIEQLLKTSWEEAMQEHLFLPLKIKSAGFGPPMGPSAISGHLEGEPTAHDNPPLYGPAGRVHISLPDWTLFCQDQLKGHHGQGLLLKKSSYQKLHTPVQNNYALGWAAQIVDGKVTTLSHDGSNTFWYAHATLHLDQQKGHLITLNSAHPSALAWIPKIAATLPPGSK